MVNLLFIGSLILSSPIHLFLEKPKQIKVRSLIRMMSLVIFVFLISLQAIEWGPEYFPLTILLSFWALLGLRDLFHRSGALKLENVNQEIFYTIARVATILLMALPVIIFPQSQSIPVTGEYQVMQTEFTYIDNNRVETYSDTGENRSLNVTYWYPKTTEKKFPLVIFSHGAMGVRDSNLSLYNELASHGYVVCSVDHRYQSLFTTDVNGNTTRISTSYLRELRLEDAQKDKEKSLESYRHWMKIRTDDINFVIDYVLSEATNTNDNNFYRRMDTEKIGVMGHSLGGSAALAIGRMRDDVKAIIALESPFLADIMDVKNERFVFINQDYPLPVLNIYSDSSWEHLAEWPQYKQNHNLLTAPAANVFNIHIKGSGHLTLTDLALTSPFLTRLLNGHPSPIDAQYCLQLINRISLDFFNAFLKGEGDFVPIEVY